MKKCIQSGWMLLCWCLVLSSCTTSPEQYFDRAVLNINIFTGFSGEGMLRELESPSVKMDEKGEAVAMQRREFLNTKINFIETEYEKLKALRETEDTRDMLQASIALYNYVLPVYKTAYSQLAKSYDDAASKETIESEGKAIHDKYYSGYNELFAKLISTGKLYAARHNIKVNWHDE